MARQREEPTIKSTLWAGVLAIIKSLPKETGGTGRSVGKFTQVGDTSTMSTTFTVTQPDGADKVYDITVTVEESRDDHDRLWGPGGRADQTDPGRRVVIDANLYLIGDGRGSHGFRGFGGHRFDIEFFDGRRVTTTDLWHQGVIPPKWRERYPNNARVVQPGDTA
ncbi:hypothetical protein [Nonomuraea basaltis]|uniref:hypothetical protein n=1 Tax=Nonomuraea basaltis TaxID=2495887 RepID=UPI00110C5C5D|nr:hypothetical protein [Nonomuraea basaltis]TMR92836.1 hypothetical protein EJK15_42540 [Nonomuraea basaltis]